MSVGTVNPIESFNPIKSVNPFDTVGNAVGVSMGDDTHGGGVVGWKGFVSVRDVERSRGQGSYG